MALPAICMVRWLLAEKKKIQSIQLAEQSSKNLELKMQ